MPSFTNRDLLDVLAVVRLPAVEQLLDLLRRVKVADLTTPEGLALVAVSRPQTSGWAQTPHRFSRSLPATR